MDYEIDKIVKMVLFKLGQLKKVNTIASLDYSLALTKRLSETFLIDKVENIDDCEQETKLWIPELTCVQLMSIYQGIPCDVLSQIVVDALLRGITVVVEKDSIELFNIETANTLFVNRYHEAFDVLLQSGLEVEGECITVKTVKFAGKVLTEKHLIAYTQNKVETLSIDKQTIVTPSAVDFLRQNPITLNRK